MNTVYSLLWLIFLFKWCLEAAGSFSWSTPYLAKKDHNGNKPSGFMVFLFFWWFLYLGHLWSLSQISFYNHAVIKQKWKHVNHSIYCGIICSKRLDDLASYLPVLCERTFGLNSYSPVLHFTIAEKTLHYLLSFTHTNGSTWGVICASTHEDASECGQEQPGSEASTLWYGGDLFLSLLN